MRRLDAEIKILHTDRAAAVAQTAAMTRELEAARARAERLRAHLQHVSTQPQSVQGMSERMRSMLRLAEDEVADMGARAEAEAEKRLLEADAEARLLAEAGRIDADDIRAAARAEVDAAAAGYHQARAALDEERSRATAEVAAAAVAVDEERDRMRAELSAARSAFEAEAAAVRNDLTDEQTRVRTKLDQEHRAATTEIDAARAALTAEQAQVRAEIDIARAELDAERAAATAAIGAADAAAEQRRSSVWADSEYQRALVEEDFTIAMDQRRSEAIAALGTTVTDARREADQLRAEASAEAERTLAEARTRADNMVAEAERHIDQLRALRGRITQQISGVRDDLNRATENLDQLPEELPAEPEVAFPTPTPSPESRTVDHSGEDAAARRPSPTRRTRRHQAARR